jgi:hypothetical protein
LNFGGGFPSFDEPPKRPDTKPKPASTDGAGFAFGGGFASFDEAPATAPQQTPAAGKGNPSFPAFSEPRTPTEPSGSQDPANPAEFTFTADFPSFDEPSPPQQRPVSQPGPAFPAFEEPPKQTPAGAKSGPASNSALQETAATDAFAFPADFPSFDDPGAFPSFDEPPPAGEAPQPFKSEPVPQTAAKEDSPFPPFGSPGRGPTAAATVERKKRTVGPPEQPFAQPVMAVAPTPPKVDLSFEAFGRALDAKWVAPVPDPFADLRIEDESVEDALAFLLSPRR